MVAWSEKVGPHATTQRRNEKLKKGINDRERNYQARHGRYVPYPSETWLQMRGQRTIGAIKKKSRGVVA